MQWSVLEYFVFTKPGSRVVQRCEDASFLLEKRRVFFNCLDVVFVNVQGSRPFQVTELSHAFLSVGAHLLSHMDVV